MEKKGFWANEWDLFLEDMRQLGEFCLQPIEITVPWQTKNAQMLRPTAEEIEQKADSEESMGFWQREWALFKQDLNNAKEFLTQPVTFK